MITNNTTSQTKTVRTAAAARAERAARASQKPRTARLVTDADTDALLPVYDVQSEYPALTSRNLDRREDRDAVRGITAWDGGSAENTPNVNDACFNRVAPAGSAGRSALAEQTAREIDRVLAALELSDVQETIVRLRLGGLSLQEIGDQLGENKQTIARRIDAVGRKLGIFQVEDTAWGLDAVYQQGALREIHHSLAGRPAAPASVCECSSHQFRVQRVKGVEGESSYHCTNCRAKYDKAGFDALRQGAGNLLWGS